MQFLSPRQVLENNDNIWTFQFLIQLCESSRFDLVLIGRCICLQSSCTMDTELLIIIRSINTRRSNYCSWIIINDKMHCNTSHVADELNYRRNKTHIVPEYLNIIWYTINMHCNCHLVKASGDIISIEFNWAWNVFRVMRWAINNY